ncbi:MAG: S8 family serine peptidase [Planctomycetaceae bacterium]
MAVPDVRPTLPGWSVRCRKLVARSLVCLGLAGGCLLSATCADRCWAQQPVEPVSFTQAGVPQVWKAYAGRLTFGRGQTLALVDDGCDLSKPEWQARVEDRPKVRVSYDSVDLDNDPRHEGKGYHGTTIGIPSSVNHDGRWGVAFNNQVAVIRALECCHCNLRDSQSLARGLEWIIEHHEEYHITTVNLAPVDDLEHGEPVPTEIDKPLARLRELGIWVSAPAGNHDFRNGISWPACQPQCFAIGAVRPGSDDVYLDRHQKLDLLVPAAATSSSNAILCGGVMLLREAIEQARYDWRQHAANLPEAMLKVLQETGVPVTDKATGRTHRRLDLKQAIDHVFAHPGQK